MGKQGIVSDVVRRVQERLAIGPPRRIAPGTPTPRIAIIGSGFGGIGMGIQPASGPASTRSRSSRRPTRVGGTWRDNTYPGAACDVPSHLYSFSFAPNADWTRKFPEQPEIHAYLERLRRPTSTSRDHIRFGAEVAEATFDEDAAWRLTLADGTSGRGRRRGRRHRAAQPAARPRHRGPRRLRRPVVPLGPLGPRPRPHRARRRRDRHRGERHPVRPRDRQARPGRSRSSSAAATTSAPSPTGRSPIGPGTLMRRFTVAARAPTGASIWVRFEARFAIVPPGSPLGRHVPAALRSKDLEELVSPELAGEALDARLHDRLQAHPDLERLVPDAPAAARRAGHRPDRPHRARARVVAAGERAPGRHDHLRHRLPSDRVPARRCDDHRPRRARPARRSGATAPRRTWASPSPASRTSSCSTGRTPTSATTRSSSCSSARSGTWSSCIRGARRARTSPGSTSSPRCRPRSTSGLQRELARTVWGDSCHSWYKTESGRITNNWSGTTLRYWVRTRRPDPADFEADRVAPRLRTRSSGPPTPRRLTSGIAGMGLIRPSRGAGPGGRAQVRDGSEPPQEHRHVHPARTRRRHRSRRPDRLQPAVPHRQRRAARARTAGQPPDARDHPGPRRPRRRGHGARRLRLPAPGRHRPDRRRRTWPSSDANIALLVGAMPRTGMERADLLEANGAIFTVQGKALSDNAAEGRQASSSSATRPTPTPSSPWATRRTSTPERFTAMTRLDHNRAMAQLAARVGAHRDRHQEDDDLGQPLRHPVPRHLPRRGRGRERRRQGRRPGVARERLHPDRPEARRGDHRGPRAARPRRRRPAPPSTTSATGCTGTPDGRLGVDGHPLRRQLRRARGPDVVVPLHHARTASARSCRASSIDDFSRPRIDASVAELVEERHGAGSSDRPRRSI